MKKERVRTPEGAKFAELLKERWSGTDAAFARELGQGDSAGQQVTHWKWRGVPKDLAFDAADLLGCTPKEISTLKASPGASQQRALQMTPAMALVAASTKGFDDEQITLLIQAAGFIRSGVKLIPEPARVESQQEEVKAKSPMEQIKGHILKMSDAEKGELRPLFEPGAGLTGNLGQGGPNQKMEVKN